QDHALDESEFVEISAKGKDVSYLNRRFVLGYQCAAASCGRDEGLWPLVIGMQVLVTNRLMRRRSKAVVV
ncbi:hypothetical protein, partial [Thiolapillus sp.]|uniref:hypothetical protein n=1 Tax=Thiolapillus sp. TaxID=2017437 RepID=UPI003AF4311A